MDLLFVRIPEVAVELTGGAASALAAHLPCSGSGWAGPVRCACLLLAGRRSASCWHSLTWRVPCTRTPVSRVPHTHKLIKGMPHTDLEAPAEKHQAQASSMCLYQPQVKRASHPPANRHGALSPWPGVRLVSSAISDFSIPGGVDLSKFDQISASAEAGTALGRWR
jgi:hypothetical protein